VKSTIPQLADAPVISCRPRGAWPLQLEKVRPQFGEAAKWREADFSQFLQEQSRQVIENVRAASREGQRKAKYWDEERKQTRFEVCDHVREGGTY